MISIKNMSKAYQNVVFEHITFSLKQGQTVGIVGASGEGKTTLLNLLMGLEKCDEGIITGMPKRQAAVFQEDRLLENLSAIDNLCFVSNCTHWQIEQELRVILPDLDMYQKVSELSGGMRRRVCIARAMITDADVIFLDEPFKGLDTDTKKRTIQYVRNRKNTRTLFVVTHDLAELELLGTDEIYTLKERQIAEMERKII